MVRLKKYEHRRDGNGDSKTTIETVELKEHCKKLNDDLKKCYIENNCDMKNCGNEFYRKMKWIPLCHDYDYSLKK